MRRTPDAAGCSFAIAMGIAFFLSVTFASCIYGSPLHESPRKSLPQHKIAVASPRETSLQLNAPMTLGGKTTSVTVTIIPSPDAAKYRVFYGLATQSLTGHVDSAALTFKITGLHSKSTYAFYAVALGADGQQSDPTNTVTCRIVAGATSD